MADRGHEAYTELSQMARDMYLGDEVRQVEQPLSAMRFMREHVARNCPLLIRNAVQHWPAITRWSLSYLTHSLADTPLSVALTPNGRGMHVVSTHTCTLRSGAICATVNQYCDHVLVCFCFDVVVQPMPSLPCVSTARSASCSSSRPTRQ
jgi:hypothetical protein